MNPLHFVLLVRILQLDEHDCEKSVAPDEHLVSKVVKKLQDKLVGHVIFPRFCPWMSWLRLEVD